MPPKHNSRSWNWQGEKFHSAASYSPLRSSMLVPYFPHPTSFQLYSSWGWNDPWAHTASYFRPYRVEYAAPKEPSCARQTYVENDCFKTKNRSRVENKKKVVKQIYVIKRDGRKDKCSDLNVIDEKPISVLETSAIDGKGREKLTFDIPNAKSEQSELKKPKIKKKSLLSRIEAKPSHPLDSSNWQKKKLQRLSAQELKQRNMSWVPKGSIQTQDKDDGPAKGAMQLKKKRRSKRRSSKLLVSTSSI